MSGITVANAWAMEDVLEKSLIQVIGTGKGVEVEITNITAVSSGARRLLSATEDSLAITSATSNVKVSSTSLSSIELTWLTTLCAELFGTSDPSQAYNEVLDLLNSTISNNTLTKLLIAANSSAFSDLKVFALSVQSFTSSETSNFPPTYQPTVSPATNSALAWFKDYFYVVILAFVVFVGLIFFIRQYTRSKSVDGDVLDLPVDLKLSSLRNSHPEDAEREAERESVKEGLRYMIRHLYDNKKGAADKARQIVAIINSSTVLTKEDIKELAELAHVASFADLVSSIEDEDGTMLPNLHRMSSLEAIRTNPKPGLQLSTNCANENIIMSSVEQITTPQRLEQGMAISKLYSSISSQEIVPMGENEMKGAKSPVSPTFSKPRSLEPDSPEDGFVRPGITRKNTLKLDEVYRAETGNDLKGAVSETNPLSVSVDSRSRGEGRPTRQQRRLVSSSVDGAAQLKSDDTGRSRQTGRPHDVFVARSGAADSHEMTAGEGVVASARPTSSVRRTFARRSAAYDESDDESPMPPGEGSDGLPRPSNSSPMSKAAISRALQVQLQQHR